MADAVRRWHSRLYSSCRSREILYQFRDHLGGLEHAMKPEIYMSIKETKQV
jgi:hypothetical protein